MSTANDSLRLLVVDETPAIADAIIHAAQQINVLIKLQLLDDLEVLRKSLRQKWDILLFVQGYELEVRAILDLIHGLSLDMPVVVVPPIDAVTLEPEQVESWLADGVVDVLSADQPVRLAYALRREMRNLSARRHQRELVSMLSDAERRAQILLRNSRSAVAYIDDGVHLLVNDNYVDLFGYSRAELIGLPVIDLVERQDAAAFRDFLRDYAKGDHRQEEFGFHGQTADGTTFEAALQLAPASLDGAPCLQIIIARQSADENGAKQLAEATRRDVLTGLGNRLALQETLISRRKLAQQTHALQALYFVSVDNIGQIRASHGLGGADRVIQEVAHLMQESWPQAAFARLHDANFAIIHSADSDEAALAQADKLREFLAGALISVDKRTVQVTVSIGIALIGAVSPEPDVLLSRAYEAADKVKLLTKGNGNGINLYRTSENATSSEHALREHLEETIRNGGFKLLYQPLYDTQDDTAFFFEVYVRLPLADGRLLTPDEFLPVAQRFDLEGRIDRWVLLNACKALRDVLPQHPNARLLVNLGAESLQDSGLADLLSKINAALHGGQQSRLVIQFNEADVTNYLQIAQKTAEQLHAAGCQMSINNFGASLNALSQLKLVNADMVKLDKSFLTNITVESNAQAASGLIREATELGKQVIVSYLENAASLSKSWSMGARYLQGFYLQPPSESLKMASGE